jgi:hypothetical protein
MKTQSHIKSHYKKNRDAKSPKNFLYCRIKDDGQKQFAKQVKTETAQHIARHQAHRTQNIRAGGSSDKPTAAHKKGNHNEPRVTSPSLTGLFEKFVR